MIGGGRLVIVGCGETANLAYEYFTHDSEYSVTAFAADKQYVKDTSLYGLPTVDIDEMAKMYPPTEFMAFVAMGSGQLNYQRSRMYRRIKELGYSLASYVSSKAFVWHDVAIGNNCFILENNVLQPFTSVGDDVVMWSGNHLGHRSKIGDHCFITSHVVISGFCTVGGHTFIGVNSSVADKVDIACDNFIAMNTSVTKSTCENEVYRGNPAMKAKIPARLFCGVSEN